MKVPFNTILKQFDGTPIKRQGSEATLILRDVAVESLLTVPRDEAQITGDEKAKRWFLASRVYANPAIDLTVEDIALIKKMIGKAYGPLVVGQAWELLEGRDLPDCMMKENVEEGR